ncbi:TPA: DNA polymerase [Clostridium botulinum]|uniref:DNA polymerase n=1 Tax=Clostridium botulinum TaxID=1491 RepID=UPI001C9A6690|nr:DNA polymerase [Clostridium botulinum]MBY6909546.1 DNA polymerase [Clostridium botulinum]
MELKMDLKLDNTEIKKADRVKQAKEKKAKAVYQPTWEEVWITGYGKKKGILQTKISDLDRKRVLEVKMAVENGEIGTFVESLKKFSKAHALNLYKKLMEYRRESIIAEMIAHKPDNYHCITNKEQFSELLYLLKNEKVIGLDTETTGLDYDTDYIVGISMTLPKADYHCYIPIGHLEVVGKNQVGEDKNNNPIYEDFWGLITGQLDADFVFEKLKPYLENPQLGKILHNAKFDFHMFLREGIYVRGLLMDTLIAMKVLNENELNYALKTLATKYGKYFGFEDKSMTYEELFGKGGFEKTPLDIGTVYACKDTHLCYQFYKWIDKQFKRLPKLGKIYYEIELPNTVVAFDMEKNGFLVDTEFAEKYTAELRVKVEKLEKELSELFGDININSNDQLAKVLYDDWKLEDISGKRSVDADNIKALARNNENLKLLLKYREENKLLTTYFEALPQKIWKRDGRLHGSFNQTGTKTGRYSSNSPNLQNIPPEARPMFIAPKGKVIIGKDLSQIEPRCLAYMSGDAEFQAPYLNKTDLYSTLATKVFHLSMEYCLDGAYDPTHTFKPRKRMKTGLLAVMYGTSTYTLSGQLEISIEEAEQFIEDFLTTYPTAKAYIQSIKDFVDENEYVETYEGRKRRFPKHKEIAKRYKAVVRKIEAQYGKVPSNIWTSKLPYKVKHEYWSVAKLYQRVHRQAVNAVIQGSSADYIKLVMLRVNEYLKTLGEDYKMIGSIHDEILMEVPDSITPEIIAELDRVMTNIEWFDFPVKTDTVVMYKWGEEIPVKDWLANKEEYNKKRSA